jgi:hypothetical protein
LEIGIAPAAENPATREAIFINCASAGLIVGTSARLHLPQRLTTKIFRQVEQFGRCNKQTMTKGLKVAAFPAGIAYPRLFDITAKLLVQPVVNCCYLPEDICFFSHHFLLPFIRLISCCSYNLPRLMPGHFWAVLFQLSGQAMLSCQKGQLRHWLGLTG